MKKMVTLMFILLGLLGLSGCSGNKEDVWEWAQCLTHDDIICAIPWYADGVYTELEPLSDAQLQELVTLLNCLTRKSFTQNKDLVGITPTTGIRIETTSGSYHLNNSPSPYGKYGELEIGYGGMPWWIDSAELLEFFETVTDKNLTA